MGFHIDGFARDLINLPARTFASRCPIACRCAMLLARQSPSAPPSTCCSITPSSSPARPFLVHAAGSGIGSVAIKMAKALGCTVITTVGDDAKAEKAKALGADHIIN